MTNEKVANDANLVFCNKADCEEILQLSCAKKNVLICPKCKNKMCPKCREDAHGKKSCQEVQDRSLRDWMNSKGAPKLANCPNCSALCEKIGGCPHMSCEVCQFKFRVARKWY